MRKVSVVSSNLHNRMCSPFWQLGRYLTIGSEQDRGGTPRDIAVKYHPVLSSLQVLDLPRSSGGSWGGAFNSAAPDPGAVHS
jgi:hypothetical protein